MFVYFAQVPAGEIKIGHSFNPGFRESALYRRGQHAKIIATIPHPDRATARAAERSLHEQFAGARLNGEWFSPSAALVGFIREACCVEAAKPGRQPGPDRSEAEARREAFGRRIKNWRDANGRSVKECASAASVGHATWFAWETGRSLPLSMTSAMALEGVTGGVVSARDVALASEAAA